MLRQRSATIVVGKFRTKSGLSGMFSMTFKFPKFQNTGVEITLDAGDAWSGERLSHTRWNSDFIAGIACHSLDYHEKRFVNLYVSKVLDSKISHPDIASGVYNEKKVLASARMILRKIKKSMQDWITFSELRLVHFQMPHFPEKDV